MQPKVSVVIPIYNVETYLNRCIDSVVNQTYKNLEIILVDDGSLDNCPAMCDAWAKKDGRIKVVHKQNAGLGMARNTGIDNATGKYIFFFDSDDYVDVTIVEKCVQNAEENDSDVVIYGRYDVWENGKKFKQIIDTKTSIFIKDQIQNQLLPAMFTYDMGFGVSAWSKMYNFNTLIASNVRFVSEREIISEDAYFALEFYPKIDKATIVNENLYYYFKRDNSLSHVYKIDRQEKNNYFIEQSLKVIDKDKLNMKIKNHTIARYHMYTIFAMKQVVLADISEKEKRAELDKIFKNKILQKTLILDALKIHSNSLKVFYFLLKIKCYWLCRKILYYKTIYKGV